jgi:hypothetical protein
MYADDEKDCGMVGTEKELQAYMRVLPDQELVTQRTTLLRQLDALG